MRSLVVAPVLAAAALGCSSKASVPSLGASNASGTVAVSGIQEPVAVSHVTDPVAVSAVAAPVAVSAVAAPVAVSSIASPVVVTGAVATPRPENDPERIEGGMLDTASTAGCEGSPYCRALATGPLIVTDIVATARDGQLPELTLYACKTSFVSCASAPRWRLRLSVPSPQWSFLANLPNDGRMKAYGNADGFNVRVITGARFAIRQGETLFAYSMDPFDLTWSGFRP